MAGPWEQFQNAGPSTDAKPWEQFQSSGVSAASGPDKATGGGNIPSITIRPPSARPASGQLSNTTADTAQKPGLIEGAKRGFLQQGAGAAKLASELGYNPLGPDTGKMLSQYSGQLEQQGKGTGAAGTIGEIAGSPTTYLPLGGVAKAGAQAGVNAAAKLAPNASVGIAKLLGAGAASGAVAGAAGGALTNSQDPNSGLGDRAARTALGGAEGAVGGFATTGALGLGQKIVQAGAKAAGVGARKLGSDTYELAQNTGNWHLGKDAQDVADRFRSGLQGLKTDINNSIISPSDAKIATGRTGPDPNTNLLSNAFAATRGADRDVVNGLYSGANKLGDQLKIQEPKDVVDTIRTGVQALNDEPFAQMDRATSMKLNRAGDTITSEIDKLPPDGLTVTHLAQLVRSHINPAIERAERSGNSQASQGYRAIKGYINDTIQDRLSTPAPGSPYKAGDPVAAAYKGAVGKADTAYTDFTNKFENSALATKFGLTKDLYLEMQGKGSTLSPDAMRALDGVAKNIKTPGDLTELKGLLASPQFAPGSYNKIQGAIAFKSIAQQRVNDLMDDITKSPSKIVEQEDFLRGLLKATGQSGKSGQMENFVKAAKLLNDNGVDLTAKVKDVRGLTPGQVNNLTKAGLGAATGHYAFAGSKLKDAFSRGGGTQQQALDQMAKQARQGAPGTRFSPYIQVPAGMIGAALGENPTALPGKLVNPRDNRQ